MRKVSRHPCTEFQARQNGIHAAPTKRALHCPPTPHALGMRDQYGNCDRNHRRTIRVATEIAAVLAVPNVGPGSLLGRHDRYRMQRAACRFDDVRHGVDRRDDVRHGLRPNPGPAVWSGRRPRSQCTGRRVSHRSYGGNPGGLWCVRRGEGVCRTGCGFRSDRIAAPTDGQRHVASSAGVLCLARSRVADRSPVGVGSARNGRTRVSVG